MTSMRNFMKKVMTVEFATDISMQIMYVFLFSLIMLSPDVYDYTEKVLGMENELYNGAPTTLGLALHATVYVVLMTIILVLKKGLI